MGALSPEVQSGCMLTCEASDLSPQPDPRHPRTSFVSLAEGMAQGGWLVTAFVLKETVAWEAHCCTCSSKAGGQAAGAAATPMYCGALPVCATIPQSVLRAG